MSTTTTTKQNHSRDPFSNHLWKWPLYFSMCGDEENAYWVDIFSTRFLISMFLSASNARLTLNQRHEWICKFSLINYMPQQDSKAKHTTQCWSRRGHLLFSELSCEQLIFVSFKVNSDSASGVGCCEQSRGVSARALRGTLIVSCRAGRVSAERQRGLSVPLSQHLLSSLLYTTKEGIANGLKLNFKLYFYSRIFFGTLYELEKL